MSNTFILGIDDSVDGSCYRPTLQVFQMTGSNVGNLVFHYATNKILGGDQQALPWHTPPAKLNAMGKIGVLPCANQLGPHSDYGGLANRFSGLDIPLVAIGLGAQGESSYEAIPEVPEGTRNWVRAIAQHSPDGVANIGVRGPYTLSVLQHYGLADKAVVTGCPSLFINPDPHLGRAIEQRARQPFARVAVAAGHQKWKHLARIEASLATIMTETDGAYFVQSPVEMVALARAEASLMPEADLIECRDYIRPEATLDEFKRWSLRHIRVFFNVSEWMECLHTFDFMVGVRIHGVMLALQAGVPALCIAHDSRTRELCEVMSVPFVMARDVLKGMTPEELRERFVFDGEAFDENRRKLAKNLDLFLQANEIPQSPWLSQIGAAG